MWLSILEMSNRVVDGRVSASEIRAALLGRGKPWEPASGRNEEHHETDNRLQYCPFLASAGALALADGEP